MSVVLAVNVDSVVLKSRGGAGTPSSISITPPASSGSSAKTSELCRQGARGGVLVPRCTASPGWVLCAMHRSMWVHAVLRSWAGKLSSPWGDMASIGEAGDLGKLKVEGVPGAAVCSLLMAGNLFSSPLSRAADTGRTSCSLMVVPGPSQCAQ